MKRHFLKTLLIYTSIPLFLSLQSCEEWFVPKELVGAWNAKQKFTIRYEDENGKYKFISDSVVFSLTIDEQGKISGTIGGAQLENCVVEQNRGWFGKAINIKTDFIFRGKLIGKVFSEDKTEVKEISAPFNLADSKNTNGSLFTGSGFSIFPMSGFELRKQE